MGMLFSSMFDSLFGTKEVRVLILGLDNAGKTTILFRLQLDEPVSTAPTIGFNVETLQYKNIKFQVWDLGGQSSIRPFWKCYYPNTDAVVFVVDSTDVDRLPTAKAALHGLLGEEDLKGAHLAVFANKQDLPGAVKAADISDALGLTAIKDRHWVIQATSAKDGVGLWDGFDWIVARIKGAATA